jgi:hypothetical protein
MAAPEDGCIDVSELHAVLLAARGGSEAAVTSAHVDDALAELAGQRRVAFRPFAKWYTAFYADAL